MSAFVVSKAHLDYLIEAGLGFASRADDSLYWFVPDDPFPTDHRRGEPWGPTSVEHAAARQRKLTRETADRVGEMLLAQNERSYDHRYDGQDREIRLGYHYEERGSYARLLGRFDDGWRWNRIRVDPLSALKALSCYEYQSCEDPGWGSSEARAFCDALRHRMVGALPGYDAAPWEVQSVEDMAPGPGEPSIEVPVRRGVPA